MSTINTSEDSSSSNQKLSNFKQVLDVVKENCNKLDNIKKQLGSLTTRVDNLEKDYSLLKNKINNPELKIGKNENNTSCLKLQIKRCTGTIIN